MQDEPLRWMKEVARRLESARNLARRGKFADAEAQAQAADKIHPKYGFAAQKAAGVPRQDRAVSPADRGVAPRHGGRAVDAKRSAWPTELWRWLPRTSWPETYAAALGPKLVLSWPIPKDLAAAAADRVR